MHCSKCNSQRQDEICWKCGTVTIIPTKSWEYSKLPDVDRIRELAKEVGYAIGVHGSLERDLDIIAAPWTEEAVGIHVLMEHISKGMNATIIQFERKPLGRMVASIQIDGYYKVIDISVCPRISPLAVSLS